MSSGVDSLRYCNLRKGRKEKREHIMKLSTAILRAFAAFVAASIIQALAGALLLSQVKIPDSPHAMEWTLFSTSLVIAALSVVAFRADLRGWRLGAALAGIPLIIGSINAIEGIFFLTN